MGLFGNVETVELKVEGMHCEKCVARVKDALEAVEGAASVEVVLEPGSATVTGNADANACVEAVNALGFSATLA